MAWCAARTFNVPAIDVATLRTRAPLAAGVGFASLAGSNLWRSSSSMKRATPFACLSISTDTRKLTWNDFFNILPFAFRDNPLDSEGK